MRKHYGFRFDEDGDLRRMYAVPVGEMADGSKVWMECDEKKEIIDEHTQYSLYKMANGAQLFVVLSVD